MRNLSLILFCLIFISAFAQDISEKIISSEVNDVTVFLEGAQVVRKKTVTVSKGVTVLKFNNLSPYIDAKSVQVKATGELTILSVSHQQNFLNKSSKSDEQKSLITQLEAIDDKLKVEKTYLSILIEEMAFLQDNRNISGKNEQTTLANLQQTADFYSSRLTALKLKEVERNKTIRTLEMQKSDVQQQLTTLSGKKEHPSGEVLIKVDAKQTSTYSLELSYFVANASWFPSYDVRAQSINDPIQFIYKANVKQDTKEDWKNVKLRFSSAMPDQSGVAPVLKPYLLNYNTLPPVYSIRGNQVRGKISDQNGEPLPGASVVVAGTTIGTVADMEGNYSLTIPSDASQLNVSYIGYLTQRVPVSGDVVNIKLMESQQSLNEVMVVGYGTQSKIDNTLQGRLAGLAVDKPTMRIRGSNSLAIPTIQVVKQTAIEFEIKTPYTILSDSKSYAVDMEFYDLNAHFQYYTVPKIDKDAFLIARIVDWEKYNLLAGEANIFFENTYVGKTLMDVSQAVDTLDISLGRDKKISVSRDKVKEMTSRQLIGSKKEESYGWKITVRNNKNKPINLVVLDQVPVSENSEIEVAVQQLSGAKPDTETGEVKWEFVLQPNEKRELDLKYSVKFPKNKYLVID